MSQSTAAGIAARSLSGPPSRSQQVDVWAAQAARAWLGEEVALELWAAIAAPSMEGKAAFDRVRTGLGLSADDFSGGELKEVAAIFAAASRVADSGADFTMVAIRDQAANDPKISGELRRSGNLWRTDGLEQFLTQRYKDNVAKYGATSRQLRDGESFEETAAAFARMNEIVKTLGGDTTRMSISGDVMQRTRKFHTSILAAGRDRQAATSANKLMPEDALVGTGLLITAAPAFMAGPGAGVIAVCLSAVVGIGLKAYQLATTGRAQERSTKQLVTARRDLTRTLNGWGTAK